MALSSIAYGYGHDDQPFSQVMSITLACCFPVLDGSVDGWVSSPVGTSVTGCSFLVSACRRVKALAFCACYYVLRICEPILLGGGCVCVLPLSSVVDS